MGKYSIDVIYNRKWKSNNSIMYCIVFEKAEDFEKTLSFFNVRAFDNREFLKIYESLPEIHDRPKFRLYFECKNSKREIGVMTPSHFTIHKLIKLEKD